MSYGICTLSYIPGRASASDAAEQITQLVFGEHYTVIEELEKWCKITTALDNYTCWIDKKQLTEILWTTFEEINNNSFNVVSNNQVIAIDKNNIPFFLPIGSILPFFHNKQCKIGTNTFQIKSMSSTPVAWENLLQTFGKVPYLWGGKTQVGIDCSGFSQMVYRTHGIYIPRDAYQQEADERAYSIEFDKKQAGDLAFFTNNAGKTTHVGIVLSDSKIVHASGFLRVDTLSNQGIIAETNELTHILKCIKRYENS
jgi:cell wall-associated NlpC family hydrolase